MLDIAWPEVIVIGVVTLVAVGPKDLPKVMHALGRFAAKARFFFQDLNHQLDVLAREAEVADKMKKAAEAAEKERSSSVVSRSSDEAKQDKKDDKA